MEGVEGLDVVDSPGDVTEGVSVVPVGLLLGDLVGAAVAPSEGNAEGAVVFNNANPT